MKIVHAKVDSNRRRWLGCKKGLVQSIFGRKINCIDMIGLDEKLDLTVYGHLIRFRWLLGSLLGL